jgi:glutathione S-transferase
MMKLYDAALSGNCHKVRLLLSMLKLEHEVVAMSLPGNPPIINGVNL